MTLPGIDHLSALSPAFAADAQALGMRAWGQTTRTPRETAAAFLGCDLALGLVELPLRLHTTMARQLGVSTAYLIDVIVELAPAVGYPQAAQALVNLADVTVDQDDDPATEREIAGGRAAARSVLGVRSGGPVDVGDIVIEYGTIRSTP
ncbi:hypothetical protein [Williamsia sterculiae]|uniref:Uncharacterized conserved protein YurZ, alkylhydroperoxidase/carboxymuconolactone decarboxylase family n=1 Tax=Williamsia sterculiae TaxID=1344003 RepID=A0A1N7EQ37_9NOCA|nr:hypothetical protein [Williamsia sterculiae]SIR90208.1 Uncharacterized conserved protein YurZ, alkylhydroperoxidase/carboxymuconolactone decarboxylase family [Williamsia sterculiae]